MLILSTRTQNDEVGVRTVRDLVIALLHELLLTEELGYFYVDKQCD